MTTLFEALKMFNSWSAFSAKQFYFLKRKERTATTMRFLIWIIQFQVPLTLDSRINREIYQIKKLSRLNKDFPPRPVHILEEKDNEMRWQRR